MTFVPILLLAIAAFAFAAIALRLPRPAWALLGATLMFGLAGYALQGSPGQAGAPKSAASDLGSEGAELVEARRAIYGPAPPSRYVTVSDGFARRGQFADAAGILRGSLARQPDDPEAWLALANALTEHAEGQLTPAAVYAYEQAGRVQPDQPGPGFFLGVALIRSGRLVQARALWAEMLEKAPPDAAWRDGLKERLDRLDVLIAQAGNQ
ncbi:tetratricopeptide repeat protein [Tsuneonella sp. YG55]|uniref:Tetratricopeptide repeat protein n=1 Tax=Tsuneonella litorea TaxID=2976475 RepID=A0A9X2W296_9SPHN|nr:tetratricopeptide repeat protein [Tsuneonella litorea]MCT2559737.1 tetratricopeptide repeat protein [Tsuneonella litorea]